MTNKEENGDSVCNPHTRKAALVAVHLVSQVLNEASIIANAAKDSGEPWIYLSSLKKIRLDNLLEDSHEKDLTYTVSKGDSAYMYDDKNSTVATSTPQKHEKNDIKCKIESSIIGQGDEEFEVKHHELRKSTSTFINHLFDMSDVERVIMCDEPINMEDNCSTDEILPEVIQKIIDSYITTAVEIVYDGKQEEFDVKGSTVQSTENSSYSMLDEAFSIEIQEDLAYVTEKTQLNKNITLESEYSEHDDVKDVAGDNIEKHDIRKYEDAYLSLNRDYEQFSVEEEPTLQDPKTVSLQEVELITDDTPAENVTPRQDKNELAATSGITTLGTGSRRSNIVRRCRTQGARLLSCLRGWFWRRKLLTKRKESRMCGSIRGMCPLSPDARRRACSLLDQRVLRTPSPTKSVVWKFNTVNEALVHSSRWKNFGYKMSLNENDEF